MLVDLTFQQQVMPTLVTLVVVNLSRSIVDRIDYSNDTGTASPKGPLSTGRSALVATGNQSFGYFAGGGYNASTIVDRVDYSSDTATGRQRGPLSAAQRYSGGNSSRENAIPAIGTVNYAAGTLGTHNKGYFFGGGPIDQKFIDLIILMMILQNFQLHFYNLDTVVPV